MKKTLIIAISTLLSGCAGMNSEFEFNKPATDSGYWMQQADEMTNGSPESLNNAGKNSNAKVDIKSYKLMNISNITLPIKFSYAQPTRSQPINNVVERDKKTLLKSQSIPMNNEIKPTTIITNVPTNNINQGYTNCSQKRCYQEIAEPIMTPDKVQRVWFAPYVSPDNNVHIGEVVYFVSDKSHWYGME